MSDELRCEECNALGGPDGELLCRFLTDSRWRCYDRMACFKRMMPRTKEASRDLGTYQEHGSQRTNDACPSRSPKGNQCIERAGHFGNVHASPRHQDEWIEDLPEQRPDSALPQRQAWLAFVDVFSRCWCGVTREGTATWATHHVQCIPDLPRARGGA